MGRRVNANGFRLGIRSTWNKLLGPAFRNAILEHKLNALSEYIETYLKRIKESVIKIHKTVAPKTPRLITWKPTIIGGKNSQATKRQYFLETQATIPLKEHITPKIIKKKISIIVGAIKYAITPFKIRIYVPISKLSTDNTLDLLIKEDLLPKLVKLLENNNNKSIQQLELIIKRIKWQNYDVEMLCKWIVFAMEKGLTELEITNSLETWYNESQKHIGLHMEICGRPFGVEQAEKSKYSLGMIGTQDINKNVKYYQGDAYTKHGVIGIKLWLHLKN